MKLLLDAALPESLIEYSTPLLELDAASAVLGAMSDPEAVQYAADAGFDGIAFLGRETLASVPVVSAAVTSRVGLVVTQSDEPVEAEKQIAENFEALEREIGPGKAVVVFASGVRVLDLIERLGAREAVKPN